MIGQLLKGNSNLSITQCHVAVAVGTEAVHLSVVTEEHPECGLQATSCVLDL